MAEFSWPGKGVLVTGATGFIGGWLAEELARRGARVVVLARDADPSVGRVHPELWEKAVSVRGDLTDLGTLRRVLSEYGVSSCFHLAAQAAVQSALSDPVGTFESNVRGTWTLLEACRLVGGIEKIIVASSDKAYGEHKELPYTEESSLLGRYPYDASKVAAEVIARSYFHTYELPIVITRNANIYGGGDLSGHRLVPEAMVAVLSGRRPVIRSDGSPERDYLYIKDAVSAYVTLAEQMDQSKLIGEAFNFGTGAPVSVLDLIRMILKVSGSDLEPDVRGTATKELSRQYLSADKAKRVLGWEPKYSLEDGLKETLDWYRANLDLMNPWS